MVRCFFFCSAEAAFGSILTKVTETQAFLKRGFSYPCAMGTSVSSQAQAAASLKRETEPLRAAADRERVTSASVGSGASFTHVYPSNPTLRVGALVLWWCYGSRRYSVRVNNSM